jgi:hypothetical protein
MPNSDINHQFRQTRLIGLLRLPCLFFIYFDGTGKGRRLAYRLFRHISRGSRVVCGAHAWAYDTAVSSGIIHNWLRDWDGGGNHPGYALGTWLRDYKEQVFLLTSNFAVSWTNNVSERGAKAAKRHQAVSGYWHSLATLAPWCRLRSYLDTAAAHGITAIDAMQRHRRETLATATPRNPLTPVRGTP